MQIYFVRHGKTEWNLASRFQGAHGDSPLLKQSLADVHKLGQFLKNTEFKAVYASPLPRAQLTAQELVKALGNNLPVISDARLREIDLGKLEGMKFKRAQELYPDLINNFWHHPDRYDPRIINGESYQEVIERGHAFGQEMAAKYPAPDDKIIAVSHGAALAGIIGGLLAYPLAQLRKNGGLANSSLSIVESQDAGRSFQLKAYNETKFLKRKLSETDSL